MYIPSIMQRRLRHSGDPFTLVIDCHLP